MTFSKSFGLAVQSGVSRRDTNDLGPTEHSDQTALATPSVVCGIMTTWNLRPGLRIEEALLEKFAHRHGVGRLALFGSVLRDDFSATSDIDILVEFLPGKTPGLLHIAAMELELEAVLGRRVELRTYEDLSRHFRDQVAATARVLYAA